MTRKKSETKKKIKKKYVSLTCRVHAVRDIPRFVTLYARPHPSEDPKNNDRFLASTVLGEEKSLITKYTRHTHSIKLLL